MAHLINPNPQKLSAEETVRFEKFARREGHSNLTKEGDRYCNGIVNNLRDAWLEALRGK